MYINSIQNDSIPSNDETILSKTICNWIINNEVEILVLISVNLQQIEIDILL